MEFNSHPGLHTKLTRYQSAKPLTIKQQNLQAALEGTSRSPSPKPLTHVREQEDLRKETISAFHTAVNNKDEEEEDDLLVLREKTKDEVEKEEEEYRAYLEREVGEDLSKLIEVEKDEDAVKVEEEEADKEDTSERKEKKNKKEKGKEKKSKDGKKKSKQEADQEFLLEYVPGFSSLISFLCRPIGI